MRCAVCGERMQHSGTYRTQDTYECPNRCTPAPTPEPVDNRVHKIDCDMGVDCLCEAGLTAPAPPPREFKVVSFQRWNPETQRYEDVS